MPKKKEARAPIEVKVSWGVKEIPKSARTERASKYAGVLEQIQKKPGRPALLGTFPESTTTSLIVGLKAAAKKTGNPEQYTFAARRTVEDPGVYAVYGMFNPEGKTPEAPKQKRKYTKKATPTPMPLDNPLDNVFPKVNTL